MVQIEFEGIISHEDPTCWVDCPCGEKPFVSNGKEEGYECKCGRKYITEFNVYEIKE